MEMSVVSMSSEAEASQNSTSAMMSTALQGRSIAEMTSIIRKPVPATGAFVNVSEIPKSAKPHHQSIAEMSSTTRRPVPASSGLRMITQGPVNSETALVHVPRAE